MLIYIAGPYTAETKQEQKQNIRKAEEVGQSVLAMGFIPVIPHKITGMWDHWGELTHWTHEDWMQKFCFPLLDRCDAVLFTPGSEESKGSRMEYERAKERRKLVFSRLDELRIWAPKKEDPYHPGMRYV